MLRFSDILKIFFDSVLNEIILKFKKNRKYNINNDIHGINLGCGIDILPNWIGLDGGSGIFVINLFPKFISKRLFKYFIMSKQYNFDEFYTKIKKSKIIHFNILFGLPFYNNTISNIYSSHFIEHIFQNEAQKVLNECFRVMKNNAYLRICVPSFDEEVNEIKNAVLNYDSGNIDSVQKYLTRGETGFVNKFSNHKHMYNFITLKTMLEKSGFKMIEEKNFGVGDITDCDKLETRNGLIIECKKIN